MSKNVLWLVGCSVFGQTLNVFWTCKLLATIWDLKTLTILRKRKTRYAVSCLEGFMHWINSLDEITTFSPCQRSAFWSLTFVNTFCSTTYSSWAALYVWCLNLRTSFICHPFLYLLVFTLCANKDLKRGLKLCFSLSRLALQSLQPEL